MSFMKTDYVVRLGKPRFLVSLRKSFDHFQEVISFDYYVRHRQNDKLFAVCGSL